MMLREFLSQTAQEIDQGLHMKFRNNIRLVALFGVTLTFLSVGTTAVAQGLQPPFMAPTPPSLTYGVFYFQAGAKYRNVDTFRFDVSGTPNTIVVNPGTIPFGPTTAGAFGVGTGTTGFSGGAGAIWIYDNGQVNSAVTPDGVAISEPNPTPPPTDIFCKGPDTVWSYSVIQPELGRFQTLGTGGCAGFTVPQEIGSFSIVDPTTQVNNLASFAGTTAVTFTLALSDSLAFKTNTTPDADRVLQAAVVGPSFEMGYQFSNYFDLFSGFSWFTTSNSITLSDVIQGQGSLTTIIDTFPFVSDDTGAWPLTNFNSSEDGSTANIYRIAPDGPAQGVFPTRQFSTEPYAAIPIENIQETISNTAEFTPFESRFGARSWAPLYGLGRIGVTLGTAIIPTYYKISGSSSYIATGSSGTVAPGAVLSAQVRENKDWRTLYGLFVGGDLSLGNTGYFLNASADYMWATALSYELGAVKTTFNPGGFTAGLNAGVQF